MPYLLLEGKEEVSRLSRKRSPKPGCQWRSDKEDDVIDSANGKDMKLIFEFKMSVLISSISIVVNNTQKRPSKDG